MIQPLISPLTWMKLSQDERSKLRVLFDIPRKGAVETLNGIPLSDGTTPVDLLALTVEKMQAYLKSDDHDIHVLLHEVVESFKVPVIEPGYVIVDNTEFPVGTPIKEIVEKVIIKNVKNKKNAK